ncbi:hypothetical protein GLOIN_2v1557277 [Rhizophagus irregularis DAOM 181602=DAOM 197198]|nr:hypothetical protein GLOIN_2v1557277 [Rhizophagus irregularis DAOM 181602=DAOM 197198]
MSNKTKESDKTKTPDKLDKFLAGGDITLNCLISDEGVNDIFEVTISNANNNKVSSLVKAIRTYCLDRFQDIDSTNLALYRVTFIADSVIINSLRNISEFEVESAIRMELQDTIFTHFPIQPQCIFGGKDLGLSELALKILENEEINGRTFFKVTKEKLECHGMKLGPVTALVDFAKEYKEKKLRSFSSYKTKKELNEMLCKYGIVSGDITCIPQFIPPTHTINESTPKFKLCIDNILRRIKNMGPVMNIIMNKKKWKVDEAFDPDYDYVYGIVSTETDWYFILHSTEGIYSTSRTEYRISLTENALKDDTELRKNVKRVLEVIVGLLKDRAVGSEELATKKRHIKEIVKKK